MKIRLLLIGQSDEAWLMEALEKYRRRVERYLPFEMEYIPDIKNRKKLSFARQKEEEGRLILSRIKADEQVVLLDEKGVTYTSRGFAGFLQKRMNAGTKSLVFVVGGPYGFSQELYRRFPARVSLSRMTFSHQMVRLIAIEQIYRALSILRNEPYHHD